MSTEINFQNVDMFVKSITSTGVVAGTTLTGDGAGLTGLPAATINEFYAKAILTSDATVNDSAAFTQKNVFPVTGSLALNIGGFTSTTSGIVVPETGTYLVGISAYFISTVQRSNIGVTFTVNGTPQTELGANSYIRLQNNHNEATSHLTTLLDLVAGDEVGAAFQQLALAGTVTLTSNGTEDSHVFLYRVA